MNDSLVYDGRSISYDHEKVILGKSIYKSVMPAEFYKEIFRGRNEATHQEVAVTLIHKMTPKGAEMGMHEMECLKLFKDLDGVVETYAILESSRFIAFIQKFYEGGDLYSLIKKRSLNETEKRTVFKDILRAVLGIHQLGYLYVDTSTKNFLLNADVTEARLGDFGSAKRKDTHSKPHGILVMSSFAPELMKNRYEALPLRETEKTDAWGLGNAFYLAHYGMFTPWYIALRSRRKKEAYEMMSDVDRLQKPKDLSSLDYLIWAMLRPNPYERFSVEQAMEWLLK